MAKTLWSQCRDQGLILGHRTRSYMPQLRCGTVKKRYIYKVSSWTMTGMTFPPLPHICLCVLVAHFSPPGSSVHGVLQSRILEWVAVPFSRGSSQPGIEPWSPALEADSLVSEPTVKPNIISGHLPNPVSFTFIFSAGSDFSPLTPSYSLLHQPLLPSYYIYCNHFAHFSHSMSPILPD